VNERTACGGCGSGNLEVALDLGSTPLANTMPTSPDGEQRWPLRLGVCTRCWLVQQLALPPDDLVYGDDYAFYAGTSPGKVAYDAELARRLLTEHGPQAHRLTVEVGVNDGDFLRHFADADCPVVGVDPSGGPAKMAASRGLPVLVEPFGVATARRIVEQSGQAGLIVANHVAAHVVDIHDFFEGFAVLLDQDGRAVVEVQYLVDLLVGNQLDHVYHEHRYHWTVGTLSGVVNQHGLRVADVRHLPDVQSGSISVTLVHARGQDPPLNSEEWLRRWSTYRSLQSRADYIAVLLRALLEREKIAGHEVAGYAAPAKATTLLNFARIGTDLLPYVADRTPAKQGRYVPGTGIPIAAPGDRPDPDVWLVLAHTYLGEILRRESAFTAGGGRWMVPIPIPAML